MPALNAAAGAVEQAAADAEAAAGGPGSWFSLTSACLEAEARSPREGYIGASRSHLSVLSTRLGSMKPFLMEAAIHCPTVVLCTL